MRTSLMALALCLACVPVAAQRLPSTATPVRYALWFAPDLERETFRGRESIDVTLAAPSTSITLHAAEITFGEVSIEDAGGSQPARVSLNAAAETATLTVPRAIVRGPATIRITYTGILNDKLRSGVEPVVGSTVGVAPCSPVVTDAREDELSVNDAARAVVREARAEGRRLAGLGHRVHARDSRTDVLFDLARARGIAGDGVQFMQALELIVREEIKPLPINVDGALAAVLHDMGFPPRCGRLVFIIGRVAGLTAEVAEEHASRE